MPHVQKVCSLIRKNQNFRVVCYMSDWIKLETKFANKCITCGERVDVGETVMWQKGTGIKHEPECEDSDTGFKEDNSALIIIEEKEWKDFEKYDTTTLRKINTCQCCGNSLDRTKDTFINGNKRTCEVCFLK